MTVTESAPLVTIDNFHAIFDPTAADAVVEATVEMAVTSPIGLYHFMQRYAHFNGYAGSLVARLASSIGISRHLFNQTDIAITDRADCGMDIAAKVLAATLDEHADAGAKQLTHRTLAQATMQALGDYARLSDRECNQIAQTPEWLNIVVSDFIAGYQGKIDDLQALATAVGFHVGSELLADREYSLIDKVVRHTHRNEGFDAYLKGKQIEIAGKRLSPWYWIVVHGKHNDTGVEAEHCALAIEALNLMAVSSSASPQQIWAWASAGFLEFARIQQALLLGCQSEIAQLNSVARLGSETSVGVGCIVPLPAGWESERSIVRIPQNQLN